MLFAGMILEGGIIGYDSNTMSGGSGARLLGIGASTEYRQDEVTISLRAVSVATGEVLTVVNISKSVYSFQDKAGVLRFYDAGTRSLELETGSATNESMNKAIQLAIHAAVIELIREGERKGHWSYKSEEKKDELVQKNATSKVESEAIPPASKPDDGKNTGGESPKAK
jgi:curli production assembly/transport component CsgG